MRDEFIEFLEDRGISLIKTIYNNFGDVDHYVVKPFNQNGAIYCSKRFIYWGKGQYAIYN